MAASTAIHATKLKTYSTAPMTKVGEASACSKAESDSEVVSARPDLIISRPRLLATV